MISPFEIQIERGNGTRTVLFSGSQKDELFRHILNSAGQVICCSDDLIDTYIDAGVEDSWQLALRKNYIIDEYVILNSQGPGFSLARRIPEKIKTHATIIWSEHEIPRDLKQLYADLGFNDHATRDEYVGRLEGLQKEFGVGKVISNPGIFTGDLWERYRK